MPTKMAGDKGFSKLSLINQFDELVRIYNTLIEGSCDKGIMFYLSNVTVDSAIVQFKLRQLSSMSQ